MERPNIICHMTVSLDGKVTGDFLSCSACEAAVETYYEINRAYQADAYACGRVTMEGSFTGGWTPDLSPFAGVTVPREDYVADPSAAFFAVAFDRRGRLGWKTGRIEDEDPGYGGAHIIEVLCEDAADDYLVYLRSIGVSYLFAGEHELDLPLALGKLKKRFGINRLLLEGGSLINGAFQREGVIDELSLVVAPMVAQSDGKPLFTDSGLEQYHLTDVKQHDGDVLSLRYVKTSAGNARDDGVEWFAKCCEDCLPLAGAALSDAYYYDSLPQCVIDAVFSIGVRYAAVERTVACYCRKTGVPVHNRDRFATGDRHTVSELIERLECCGVQESAAALFANRQRTSARNGILKAEAVYRFAKVLQKYGVETLADLKGGLPVQAEEEVRQIPGQKSGLSLQYFYMLAGDDSLAKPDRHILRFLENRTGRKMTAQEAQAFLTETVSLLQKTYPHMTVRLLDYTIWNYMSQGGDHT